MTISLKDIMKMQKIIIRKSVLYILRQRKLSLREKKTLTGFRQDIQKFLIFWKKSLMKKKTLIK